jgi:preprotein translocase subunit SecE
MNLKEATAVRDSGHAARPMTDRLKIAAAIALVCAGVAGFYYLGEHAMIIRVFAVMGGVIAGGGVFASSVHGREFFRFSQESIAETKKVVWPTRKETLQTTGVVFAFVVVMAVFLWMVDASLLWVVKKLLG